LKCMVFPQTGVMSFAAQLFLVKGETVDLSPFTNPCLGFSTDRLGADFSG
jgi:hypothetical protein